MRDSACRGAIQIGVLFLLIGVLSAVPALGETTEPEHGESGTEEESSHLHRNHFMGIVGWSHKDTSKDAVTFGMEYTRLFTRQIGVAAYLELTEGQFKVDTVGLTLVGFPTKHLSVFAGPGLERSLFEDEEYLTRLGVGYTFHPKSVIVTPLAWVDYVGGHKIYFLGVGVGKGF